MLERDTGSVRFRFDGDVRAAQDVAGFARTQLGILKNLMSFGKLQQLSRQIMLEDGTVIYCQSVFGQDTIAITAPIAATTQQPKQTPPTGTRVVSKGSVFAGRASFDGVEAAFRWHDNVAEVLQASGIYSSANCVSDDGTIFAGAVQLSTTYSGAIWADGEVTVLPGIGATSSFVNDISGDGLTVVGSAGVAPYSAVKWTNNELSVLAPLAGASGAQAYGVSEDGAVIVGLSRYATYDMPVIWTDGVPAALPLLHLDDTGGQANAVSNDGTVIVGLVERGVFPERQEFLVMWVNGNIQEVSVSVGSSPYLYEVSSSDKNGIVVVGTTIVSGRTKPFCWRNGVVELLSIPGDSGAAVCVSADGSTIGGETHNSAEGILTPTYWQNAQRVCMTDTVGQIFGASDPVGYKMVSE